jgi:glycosyltransferase 2 family protein
MADAKNSKSKYIFLFLRIAVIAGGIIWAIFWLRGGQRWENLTAIFRRMNLLIFAGMLCVFVVAQFMVAFRWRMLLGTQSVFIDYLAAVKLHFLGLFYNNFMPSALGGDLIRAWYVTRHTDKKFEAALSVLVDRIVGSIGTAIIAVFFYYVVFILGSSQEITFSEKGGFLQSVLAYKQIVFVAIILLAVIFGMIALLKSGRDLLKRIWQNIWVHGTKVIKKLRDMVVIYCSKPLTIFAALGVTIFLQIITITGFWFLGRNIGIEAGLKYYYVFFPLTWVLGAMPVSIGGAVVVEGLLAYMFVHFAGVNVEAALALALCQRIVWMITSLPGAAIHLMGAHLPKDFTIDY